MKCIKIFLLWVSALIAAGCANYQLGSTLPETVQSVGIEVLNRTDEPSVEVDVVKALRAEFQRDGRLAVRPAREADTILRVTLTGYDLNALAFDRRRGSLAREYRVVLRASSVLCSREHEDVLVETPEIVGESEFSYSADLSSAKRRALPGAARDLARKAVSRVTTAW